MIEEGDKEDEEEGRQVATTPGLVSSAFDPSERAFCPILSRVSCQACSDFDSPHVMKTLVVHYHDLLQSSLGPFSFMYSNMSLTLSSA